MQGTDHSPRLAWILVAACVACGREPRVVAPKSATAAPARCAVEDRDVAFASIPLQAEPPPAETMAIYPFAELRHGDLVRVELPPGNASVVRVDVETTRLRLHGFAQAASDAVFYPDSPSVFGDLVVPLATNHLAVREVRDDKVLVLPGHQPGAPTSISPEWRGCSYLRLHPRPRFDLRELGLRTHRLILPRGGYLVRASPDAPGSKVSLELSGGEEIWLLETRKTWARILWEASEVAVVGWIDRSDGPGPAMGHGSGTGEGVYTNTCVPGPVRCDADVPLFTERDGRVIEIGSIKQGASMTFGRVRGDYTEIEICDPDVTLVETVVVKTRDALRCHITPAALPSRAASSCEGM